MYLVILLNCTIYDIFFEISTLSRMKISRGIMSRDRPRFFDQVGHQTTNASIGNKYFFTK